MLLGQTNNNNGIIVNPLGSLRICLFFSQPTFSTSSQVCHAGKEVPLRACVACVPASKSATNSFEECYSNVFQYSLCWAGARFVKRNQSVLHCHYSHLFLSILMAIFPGEPELTGFIGAKDNRSGGDKWSYKTCKAPVKLLPPTNRQPTFYRLDALPVAQPTPSKHWRDD